MSSRKISTQNPQFKITQNDRTKKTTFTYNPSKLFSNNFAASAIFGCFGAILGIIVLIYIQENILGMSREEAAEGGFAAAFAMGAGFVVVFLLYRFLSNRNLIPLGLFGSKDVVFSGDRLKASDYKASGISEKIKGLPLGDDVAFVVEPDHRSKAVLGNDAKRAYQWATVVTARQGPGGSLSDTLIEIRKDSAKMGMGHAIASHIALAHKHHVERYMGGAPDIVPVSEVSAAAPKTPPSQFE